MTSSNIQGLGSHPAFVLIVSSVQWPLVTLRLDWLLAHSQEAEPMITEDVGLGFAPCHGKNRVHDLYDGFQGSKVVVLNQGPCNFTGGPLKPNTSSKLGVHNNI